MLSEYDKVRLTFRHFFASADFVCVNILCSNCDAECQL